MVIQGRGQFKGNRPAKQPDRPSPTPHIGKIASLKRMKSRDDALDLLHDIARIVAPIMSQYGFKVGTLCEMFPKNASLLGLNVNKGSKVCLRLRPAHNKEMFYPMEELIGTMLHELAHNRCGPHNDKFYKLLDELKEKYYEIQRVGSYKATGYLTESNRLGRRSVTTGRVRDMRLKKLQPKYKGKTARLGSNTPGNPTHAKSMRELLREATERRIHDSKVCSSDKPDAEESVPGDDELTVQVIDDHEVIIID